MAISWAQVAHEFAHDGSLRDIYVHTTDLADWDSLLVLLRRKYGPLVFTRDGATVPLPPSAAEVFAQRPDASVALDFEVGGIQLACHFFTPAEIEFDLPPEQIDSPVRFEALQAFLRDVAVTIGKTATLTPESGAEMPILSVDPLTGQVAYHEEPDAPAI